jgi:hypothetical protein
MRIFPLNRLKPDIKKVIFQLSLLMLLAAVCLAAFLTAGHVLKLPFRSVNESLHRENAAFTLDVFIPGGTHIDERMTIGEVIKIRVRKERSLYENVIRTFASIIPPPCRYAVNALLFLFGTFLFMVFLRVFTFTGYGRALRISLLSSGLIYFFLPDFSPGKIDDAIFVIAPLLIIFFRSYLSRQRKKAAQKFA